MEDGVTAAIDGIECSECCKALDESYRVPSNEPCPRCGSIRRTVYVSTIVSTMPQMYDKAAWQSGDLRRGKPLRWGVTGDDLHRKSGRWSTLERIFDRIKDYYYEHIADKETGTVDQALRRKAE